MDAIAPARRSQGFTTETVMITETILKRLIVKNSDIYGNARSMMVISFVNLVDILPEGFESKNNMVALITFCVIESCMFDLAFKNMI
jgi:hypothetical protein